MLWAEKLNCRPACEAGCLLGHCFRKWEIERERESRREMVYERGRERQREGPDGGSERDIDLERG